MALTPFYIFRLGNLNGIYGRVFQLVENGTFNAEVAGSTPVTPSILTEIVIRVRVGL